MKRRNHQGLLKIEMLLLVQVLLGYKSLEAAKMFWGITVLYYSLLTLFLWESTLGCHQERLLGIIGCLIWSNINSSCEKRTKYLAYLNKHKYCWNFPNTAFFSAKHLLSLSSYYMIKKTSALVRVIWYFAFWEPFHISLLSSWWLSMVSIIRQDGYFFPFTQLSFFPKSKLRDNKLIKSIIYVMHHELSCNINWPEANQASPTSTKHRLLRFKQLPSAVFYCFCWEYSELATVSSFTL